MSFTDGLWAENAALFERIVAMPFNAELAAGTLPAEAFRRYVVQDAHYLEGFARALAICAARAPDADAVAQLSGAAQGAILVERSLHETYFATFGVTREAFAATERSPVCEHYVSFLLAAAATEDVAVAAAALLPCFWVYREVGQRIHAAAAKPNPYQAWIDTYAGDAFDEAVRAMIALVERLAAAAGEDARLRMARAYRRSTVLEWMFWDGAYHDRGWPAWGEGGAG